MKVLFETDQGPLEGFSSASFQIVLNDVGVGELEADPTIEPFGTLADGGTVRCLVDGQERLRWQVEEQDRTDDDHAVVRLSGRGPAARLEGAVVLPEGYPNHTVRQRQLAGAPLDIFQVLFDEAQARGRLSGLQLDLAGGWQSTFDVELEPGVDLAQLLSEMAEVEPAEWLMTSNTLQVARELGTDRPDVVLWVGRHQLSRGRRTSTRRQRGTVYVESSTGVSEAGDGGAEIWVESEDFADGTSRAAVAQRLAESLSEPQVEVEVQVDEECGLFDTFDVGDTVTLDLGGEHREPVRVVGATVQVDQDGHVHLELTLVSAAELRTRRIERAIEAKADVKLAASVSLQRRHGLVRADRIETGSLQADAEIRSSDFVAGQEGWRISGNGDVEFDRGTFRGDLEAAGGTFSGSLEAVDGTFTGEITASQITTGTLDAVRIPNLSADKITSGTFSAVRIPNLSADKITSGTFSAVRIPNLSADKITTGTLSGVTVEGGSTTLNSDGITITAGTGISERIRWTQFGSTRADIYTTSQGALFIEPEGDFVADCRSAVLDASRFALIDGADGVEIRQGGSLVMKTFEGSSGIVGEFPGTLTNTGHGTTASSANVVLFSSSGRFARSTSLAADKTDVEDVELAYAERVLDLRPVFFRSAADLDRREWTHYGLIAEEVDQVEPRLAWRDPESGELAGVQYDRVPVLLLSVVQRLVKRVEALEAER